MKYAVAFALAGGLFAAPALAAPIELADGQLDAVAAGIQFKIDRLVADQTGRAPTIDPLLINPWGLSQSPTSALWVANQGSNTSTLYDRNTFAKNPLNVNVPGGPTGTVFQPVADAFQISNGTTSARSLFMFATLSGTIQGWAPQVNPTNAITAVTSPGAVYTGLAFGNSEVTGPRIFAADFRQNKVDMFDSAFASKGSFTDAQVPAGFAAFNAQALNGKIYVAFAKQGPDGPAAAGAGLGYVDVFDTTGALQQRLVSGGPLNAPWGMTIAPAGFGEFAGALLVGNFGDGKINAFDPQTGAFLGELTNVSGLPVKIDKLWALTSGPNGSVTFAAGVQQEQHGLLGGISPGNAIDALNFLRFPTRAKALDFLLVR